MAEEGVNADLLHALRLCAEGLRHYTGVRYRGSSPVPDSDAHALRVAEQAIRNAEELKHAQET